MTVRRALPTVWSWVMALAVCAPLLQPGYVLSYDMVWVPRLSLDRRDVWGLGEALPRAVPSDAVVGLLNIAIPGQLLQKLILVGMLAGAGCAIVRLVPSPSVVARCAAASLYVWNPFVAERLNLGQWPLLVAYAAMPWVIVLARDLERRGRLAPLVMALALTALTPASGLMGAGAVLVCAWPGPAGRRARLMRVTAVALAVNAPWIVSGLLHGGGARSDAAAVKAFSAQAEGALGHLGAILSLGGIWNVDVAPASRLLGLALVFAIVLWVVIALGLLVLVRTHATLLAPLVILGVTGLALALAGWLAPSLVSWVVSTVPGGGLVRDGTRYLALLAPLWAIGFGLGAEAIVKAVTFKEARIIVAIGVLAMPIAALPDLAWGVGGRLEPVAYPASWYAAERAIASEPDGPLLVLPFNAYRAPAWNGGRPVLDPAGRFFPRLTIVNDELTVSDTTIKGENPQARRIEKILEGSNVSARLRAEGIGLVVTSSPDPLRYERLEGAVSPTLLDRSDVVVMILAWLLAAGAIVLAAITLVRHRLER
ncbi:hypothetical protein BH09ACT10_BH09ACT10_02300 [soil metagenome]